MANILLDEVKLEKPVKKQRDKYRFRLALRAALRSDRFESFLTRMIVLYAVILAAHCYIQPQAETYPFTAHMVEGFDFAIFSAFCVEILIKLYAFRGKFFRNGWNVFDFLVIALSIIGMAASITAFRVLRVLRTLRLVTNVPSMRVVIESFLRSIPGIFSVLMVLLLMVFVYAVIGQNLYSHIAPKLFGTLQNSAFTLFTVLTLEGWPEVSRAVMAKQPSSWIYFVSFIAINSFTVLNLMIAVIIGSMQKEYDEEAEEEREDILHEIQALRRELAMFQLQHQKITASRSPNRVDPPQE